MKDVGGALDYYQWTALLRSVSAFETYRGLYRDQILPIKVAQLLILEQRMPRSLAACFDQITQAMDRMQGQRPRRQAAGERTARAPDANADIEEIFLAGLHEYLDRLHRRHARARQRASSAPTSAPALARNRRPRVRSTSR